MADSREQLQQQMAEICNRYLRRTFGELTRLRELVSTLESGAAALWEELEHLSHRIHGSGAMFGFDAVSEEARHIELIAARRSLEGTVRQELDERVVTLERMVHEAARTRGFELS